MPGKKILRKTIKQILLTNSSTKNINYDNTQLPSRALDLLRKYAYQNPVGLHHLLLKFQEDISDTDIPLYALAMLCSAKTEYAILKEVFQIYVSDILLVIRFAEIMRKESVAVEISGPIKKILKYRLARLDEDDIALYFSEPEFTFRVTINDLIQLTKPKFRDSDITTALNWLHKKRYNRRILMQKYPNLLLLTKLINEKNIHNAELLLNDYTGDFRPILLILSAMDQNLFDNTLEKICINEFANRVVGLKFIPGIGRLLKRIKPDSLKRLVPRALKRISPENNIFRILPKMRYIPIELIGKNALFIDFSGSNLQAYKSKVVDEYNQTVRLISQMLTFFADLGLDSESTDFFIFDDHAKKIAYSNTIESSIIKRLRFYHDKYKLGEIETPFKKIISSKIAYESIFILTNHAFSYSTLKLWEEYRYAINKKAKLFLIQYDAYNFQNIDLPESYFRIIGWNESSVRNVKNIIKRL